MDRSEHYEHEGRQQQPQQLWRARLTMACLEHRGTPTSHLLLILLLQKDSGGDADAFFDVLRSCRTLNGKAVGARQILTELVFGLCEHLLGRHLW